MKYGRKITKLKELAVREKIDSLDRTESRVFLSNSDLIQISIKKDSQSLVSYNDTALSTAFKNDTSVDQ